MGKALVLAVMGPTASGKARLARAVAERSGAVLLACDSMKVYRGMDVGTAKPAAAERDRWLGLDLVDPWEAFSADRFRAVFDQALARAASAGRPLLLAGGTMLYLKAATEGLCEVPRDEAVRRALEAEAEAAGSPALHARLASVDPVAAGRIHPNDRRRIVRALEVQTLVQRPLSALQEQFGHVRDDLERRIFVVRRERADMDRRIDARVDQMMAEGWLEECARLREGRGISPEARQALGYAELLSWLEGGRQEPLQEVVTRIKTATRRFARKQLTWLRHLPDAQALDVSPTGEVLDHLEAVLAGL